MAVTYVGVVGTQSAPSGNSTTIAAGSANATGPASSSFTPAVGETLVVKATSQDWTAQPSTIANSAGTVTWTKVGLFGASGGCPVVFWIGQVTASAAMTVSTTYNTTAASAVSYGGFTITRWTGVGTPGGGWNAAAVVVNDATAPFSGTFTTQAANSVIDWIAADWNGVSTGTLTMAGATTIEQYYNTTTTSHQWGMVSCNTTAATAGPYTIGVTSSTAAPSETVVAIELPVPVASQPFASLVDSFPGSSLATGWIANGAGVSGGGAYVNVSQNAGAAVYSSLRSQPNYTWAGSSVTFEIGAMPGNASNTSGSGDAANAQFWVRDPNPAATVDRLGAEYAAATNTLTLRGQTGASYAAIGTDTVLPYDPVAHRWLRLDQTTSGTVVWSTSPDGLTWTVRRTLTGAPTWTTKTTLQLSIEGYRTTGTNDTLRVDNLNVTPTAPATSAPSGADALQTRTLTEVRAWESWLSSNSARGFVGELGWVTHFSGWGDTTQGAQWAALGEVYLTEADYAGLSTSVWGAGRLWGNGYPLGVVYGTNVGDPLSASAIDAAPVANHRTKGAGTAVRWRAVGLAGYERGVNIAGGGTVRSTTPYVHTQADFYYLAGFGVDTVRLAFAWERLQPTLGGALSTSALADIDGMLTAARQAGIRVILDLHNYGRFTAADGTTVTSIAGGGISDATFSGFWTLLSSWVMANPTRSGTVIGYGLMNEPHDLPNGASGWQTTSQAALTAIRGNGDAHLVTVAGYQFASLTSWSKNHPSGWITDPGTTAVPGANFVYEAHHYWDTVSVQGSRSGTYQMSNGSGGVQTETYATELASTVPQSRTDTVAGAEQGAPAESPYARPQGPVEVPSSTEEGAPREGVAGSAVVTDRPSSTEEGGPRGAAVPSTIAADQPTETEEGSPAENPIESTILHEGITGTETSAETEVELPLPPTLSVGQVGPTELDASIGNAPQVSEATLRWYGWLGSAFIAGDAQAGYPLLRFLEAGGRLLQNIEDVTRDANAAPGWSTLFDLTRAPTYALPWLGQTVGVVVDPTIPDAAQRSQIVNESGYARGTLQAVEAVALSWLTADTPLVEIVERDGNEWTFTVYVYAAQLVGRTYASLSSLYPTYQALSAAYPAYQNYTVGYSELYNALQAVKPAGLVMHLVVRTGPSYGALTGAYRTYAALSAAYATYDLMTGAQPVTS